MSSSSRSIDRLSVTFDDPSLVANAGLLLPMTMAIRLGIESLVNSIVHVRGRNGAGFRPGRKVMSLVATILAGGSHIDHAGMLRAGATQSVLPFRVMASSTLGNFLRAFNGGFVSQLDRVLAVLIERAWSTSTLPESMVIDMDSTICEVYGKLKQGAAYGYTKVLGYHPLLAIRSDTGEILHARMRKGSSQRGVQHFVSQLIARVRRCGAHGSLTLRADSGFFSFDIIKQLQALGVKYSITMSMNPALRRAIDAIDSGAWTPIGYTDSGQAEVAEGIYVRGGGKTKRGVQTFKIIVRRTKVDDPDTLQMFPDWRYHAFITDLGGDAVSLDQFHRDHARVELGIKDLKEGAGLEHCPSGKFFANAAWLACAVIAHNLLRWTAIAGDIVADNELTVARTQRVQLLSIPARIVNRSGKWTLRMPVDWPWADVFTTALDRLRRLPVISTA